ncbi:uncharacterized protein F5147DRAFT_229527 [Suillus discolor]|uniref:Integral membrane protein n=1 Tax=Suillus discolor TaxID=1912936 RepID=A0A9P7JT99_9AGAM|nr:uncharacterized protein F5147DRAFT_229527 [Suillus discolor]KAG2106620.1 hypothetical protein F5147DRAFT_229527 [Suillus discolor]
MTSYLFQPTVLKYISILHIIAMLCTIFRLVYRGWMRHLWWEDAWAAFSLISDVICLLCIWIHTSISFPTWTFSVAFTSVVWAARMSMIFSIIRIASPSGHKYQKWITYLITVSFAGMWAVVLVSKDSTCVFTCQKTMPVALLQLITDVVADVSLILAPLLFWKNTGLSSNHKILILSPFGASLLITAITIPHSVMLLHSASETTLIIAHVKAALSLVVCNLLVIVTLIYRVCWKRTLDPDQTLESPIIFTSVITAQIHVSAISITSPPVHEETTQDT